MQRSSAQITKTLSEITPKTMPASGDSIKPLCEAPDKISVVKIHEGKPIETVRDRSDIENEQKFTWAEGIVIPPEIKSEMGELKKIKEYYQKQSEALQDFLRIPENRNALGLFDMGDFGYGIIARREFKENEIATYYAGKIYTVAPSKHTYVYDSSITVKGSPLERHRLGIETKQMSGRLDASDFGNISRFMQHAPLRSELEAADLPGINKEDVAICNFETAPVLIDGMKTWLFRSNKTIEKNELAFTNYRPEYWEGETFWLFNKKTGEPIAEVRYDETNRIVLAKKELTHEASKDKLSIPSTHTQSRPGSRG